jgi:hypothetical protein
MSWGAQNRSKDAKTHGVGRGMSENPEPDLRPVQQYLYIALVVYGVGPVPEG